MYPGLFCPILYRIYHLQQFDHQTNDELENLYDKLSDDWFTEPRKQYAKNKEKSIFYLLTHFNEQVLTEIETTDGVTSAEIDLAFIELLPMWNLGFKREF